MYCKHAFSFKAVSKIKTFLSKKKTQCFDFYLEQFLKLFFRVKSIFVLIRLSFLTDKKGVFKYFTANRISRKGYH